MTIGDVRKSIAIQNYSLSIQWYLGQSARSPGQTLRYIQANRNAVEINFSISQTQRLTLVTPIPNYKITGRVFTNN